MLGLRDSEAGNGNGSLESSHYGNMLAASLSEEILNIRLQLVDFTVASRNTETVDVEEFVNDDCPAASVIGVFHSFMELFSTRCLVAMRVQLEAIVLSCLDGGRA